jgi:AcrR family transcriptional regulator
MQPTPLRQHLADPPARAATPLDAFSAGRKRFLANQPLELSSMAAELGVSRATLHRWIGTRLELLAEIAVDLCDRSLRAALEASRPKQGTDLLVAAFCRFAEFPTTRGLMTEHFAREGERSLRTLLDPAGPVRPRLLDLVQNTMAAETGRDVDEHLQTASDAVLRIIESHLWLGCFVARPLHAPLLRAQLELIVRQIQP